jgi:hypothetical protein
MMSGIVSIRFDNSRYVARKRRRLRRRARARRAVRPPVTLTMSRLNAAIEISLRPAGFLGPPGFRGLSMRCMGEHRHGQSAPRQSGRGRHDVE